MEDLGKSTEEKRLGSYFGKIYPYLGKAKAFCRDHWHLLVESAADNHLRIQKCSDGSYQCLVSFKSYSELRKYQKKLRRATVSLSSAVAIAVAAFMVAPYVINPNKSSAAGFRWIQGDWSGVAGPAAATKNGWTGYFSKDANVTAQANGVSLAFPPAQTVTEEADADFTGTKTGDGFYSDGSGRLYLKRPNGASCGAPNECASGNCAASVCS